MRGHELYTVQKGKYDFSPNRRNQYLPQCVSSCEIEFELHENCWEPPGTPGRDSWWKLGGFTAALGPNNVRSALAGVRSADAPGEFLLTPYTNDKKKGWRVGGNGPKVWEFLDIKAKQLCFIKMSLYQDQRLSNAGVGEILLASAVAPLALTQYDWYVRYEMWRAGDQVPMSWTHQFDAPWHRLYRAVGGWKGGQLPAPWKMNYEMQLKLKR